MTDSQPVRQPAPARLTPYELVFVEGEFESRIFQRVQEEATVELVEVLNPERFAFLSTAADVVREVTPEDSPPEALDQYRALLFHAFNFWRSGKRLLVPDPAVARFLVEAAPAVDDWSLATPGDAGYVQLPANLFWSSISPNATPEPVDGFFYAIRDEREYRQLEILMVLGIRRSRAGFSVIELGAYLAPEMLDSIAEAVRPDGDFTNVLPGGEISGLYSILTSAEALKLITRTFWYIERFPGERLDVPAAEPRADDGEPPPTNLAYTRITLSDASQQARDGREPVA